MGFVNEKVSDEDVVKYGIDTLWGQYHFKGEKLPGFYSSWTIDRQKDIFLMRVRTGREELFNQITFVLIGPDMRIEITLNVFGDGNNTKKGENKPITTIWELDSIHLSENCPRNKEQVLEILKEALTEYKVRGVAWPVEQHTAVFRF